MGEAMKGTAGTVFRIRGRLRGWWFRRRVMLALRLARSGSMSANTAEEVGKACANIAAAMLWRSPCKPLAVNVNAMWLPADATEPTTAAKVSVAWGFVHPQAQADEELRRSLIQETLAVAWVNTLGVAFPGKAPEKEPEG
jgi:hypothetical protein